MQTTHLLIIVLATFPLSAKCACCFGFRKVCESVPDVTSFGNSDWRSLVIMPGGCENSTLHTKIETISKDTFSKTSQLINVYIVDTIVNFEEECFAPLKENLVYLSVIKNNVSVIPKRVFEDLPKLKKLVLRDSQIEVIPQNAFKNLPKLEVLLVSGNKLKEVKNGVLNITDVKTIDLSFNTISIIEANSFPNNLILLNLKKNNLQELKDNLFSNLNSLEMLILSKNKIKSIRKGTFAGLTNLSKLDLSKNEIEIIEADTFSDLQELMFLYLKYNKLQIINADVFLTDMINLTDLELDQNLLSYLPNKIFNRMPNLEEVSLSGNPWECRCLNEIYETLKNKSISISGTDDFRPKCSVTHKTCGSVDLK